MARRSIPRGKVQVLSVRAREMRHAPTSSEALLWSALSARKLEVVFRRQVVNGEFIADFAAASVRLIVEVDGVAHRGRAQHDARRDRALERAGWRILRVDAALVMRDVAPAVALVREALAAA